MTVSSRTGTRHQCRNTGAYGGIAPSVAYYIDFTDEHMHHLCVRVFLFLVFNCVRALLRLTVAFGEL